MNDEDYRHAEEMLRAVVDHPALIRQWYAREGTRLLEQLRAITESQDGTAHREPPFVDPAATD